MKQFSAVGSTDSSKLMYYEATSLINYLEREVNKANVMRKKMLHLGYEMRFNMPRTPEQERMSPSARNYENVNAWCESKYCSNPKPLNQYTADELPAVISQFERVYKAFLKNIRRS